MTKLTASSKDSFWAVVSDESPGCGEHVWKPSPCCWKRGLDREENLDSRNSAAGGYKPENAVILTNIPFIVSPWADEFWKCSLLQWADLAAVATQLFWQQGGSNDCWKQERVWQGRAACGGKCWMELNVKGAIWVRGNSGEAHQEWRLAFRLH